MTVVVDEKTTHTFQAEVNQLLSLVVNSLYSHKEIFLRELVSNASDALDKLKFRALTEPGLGTGTPLEVRISADREAKTLSIEDTGVGMSREELIENLGTIAHSGSRAFLEQARKNGEASDVRLIGQFGVGFYSAYLVADHVEVISQAAGTQGAWRWISDAKGSYSIEPAERETHGTQILLHLGADHLEYLDEWNLRELVRRWSDFVNHPIKLITPGEDGDSEPKIETINRGTALWQRSKADVTEQEYEDLYKHLTHDWEAPLAHTHFTVEGTQLFTALLYIPKKAPFDLYMREQRRGVKLFVKRVFIMDDCEELLPAWLRFMRGVVDSDDLPLNVSREILQDSSITRTIRKQIIKKTLDLLDEMATERPDDYKAFWGTYGAVVKEGVHFEQDSRERIAGLLRFDSSADGGLTSLDDYVTRMSEAQEAIWYITGESRAAVASSPHLEALRRKGWEVLYLTDPVDEWVVESLPEFKGKKLVSAMKADIDLGETEEEKKTRDEQGDKLGPLVARMKEILSDRVTEVRLSSRLTDSAACLVVPEGGLHSHLERLLRSQDRNMPESKRILEVNPNHGIIQNMQALVDRDSEAGRLAEWTELLFDQSLLTEGSPIPDPNRFARRVTALLQQASTSAVFG